jgi:hypothetical protein
MGRVIKNAEIEVGIGGLVDDDNDRKNNAEKDDESGIKVYSAGWWRRGSAGELFR